MKKIFFALAALSIVFSSCVVNDPPPPPAGESELKGKLFINEVNGWPSDDPSKNFELYNNTNEAISLNNFVIFYGDRETWRGRAESVIPAKGWFLIQGANAGYPGLNTGLSNRNPNVSLTFFDDEGNMIDFYEKVEDLRSTPLEFMSHMRVPDGGKWYFVPTDNATPGVANPTTPPAGSTEMAPMEKGLRIETVTVSANTPAPDDAVTITARVTDVTAITSVVLKWKKDNVDQTDIEMTKGEESNYTATIPGQPDGTVVAWNIVATNDKGRTATTATETITWATLTGDYTKLKLNEVSGVGDDPDKFYELINTGTAPINLAGCQLFYNANGSTGGTMPEGDGSLTWTGNADQVIQPGGLLSLIGRNTPGSFTTGLTAGRILKITLKDPTGNVLDLCIRGEDTGIYAFTDKSFSRIPDGTGPFYFTDPTPNVTNGTSTEGLTLVPQTQEPQVDYSKLKVNEVNGVGKWFEIYNTGTEAINLENVTAHYSNKEPAEYNLTWTGTASQVIPAGGYFSTQGITLGTGLSANNGSVRLQLRAPDGTPLDTYEKLIDINAGYDVIKNKSHVRIPDGTGAWYYTTDDVGTPGATNGSSTEGYTKFGDEDGAVEADYTKLVLNEVSGNNKFVEIYNSGTAAIPLAGVKLQRNNGPAEGGSEWVGTASDAIPAGAYRLFLFNSFTPADLETNPAYVGWKVSSGISSGQVLKVAIVDPEGTPISVFIRGDDPLPAWQSTAGVTQNSTDTYSRMTDGTWAYAAPTPGAANGAKTEEIADPGYLTAQP